MPLSDSADDPQAITRMVNKAGANKGRSFFCCGKQTGPACRSFFKWSDTLPRSLLQHPTHPMNLLRALLLLPAKE